MGRRAKSAEPKPDLCRCALEEGRCAECLDSARRLIGMILEAWKSFQAQSEFAMKSAKTCHACIVHHGDEIGAEIIKGYVAHAPEAMRNHLARVTLEILVASGVTRLERTAEAVKGLNPHPTSSLDALLRALYGPGSL